MGTQFHVAIVEDRFDPLKLGRYRVRVFGSHTESLADIPVTSLPWAIPLSKNASMSGIGLAPNYVEGSLVYIFFQDEDSRQMPVIVGAVAGVPISKITFPGGTVFDEITKPLIDYPESIPPEEPPLAKDEFIPGGGSAPIPTPVPTPTPSPTPTPTPGPVGWESALKFTKDSLANLIAKINVIYMPILGNPVQLYADVVLREINGVATDDIKALVRFYTIVYQAENMALAFNRGDTASLVYMGYNMNSILNGAVFDRLTWVQAGFQLNKFPSELIINE